MRIQRIVRTKVININSLVPSHSHTHTHTHSLSHIHTHSLTYTHTHTHTAVTFGVTGVKHSQHLFCFIHKHACQEHSEFYSDPRNAIGWNLPTMYTTVSTVERDGSFCSAAIELRILLHI